MWCTSLTLFAYFLFSSDFVVHAPCNNDVIGHYYFLHVGVDKCICIHHLPLYAHPSPVQWWCIVVDDRNCKSLSLSTAGMQLNAKWGYNQDLSLVSSNGITGGEWTPVYS